jgi:hypothetical protein
VLARNIFSDQDTPAMRTTGHAALGDNYPRPFLAASASATHSDADAEGAAVAGHEITRIEVARLDFPNLY